MSKKLNGFTLIELLASIAIISVLASVIISSLNDARNQGVSAKLKAEMDAITKNAALEETTSFTYDTVCGTNGFTQSPNILGLITSINSLASSSVVCNSATTAYALSVEIGTSVHWCVDSAGSKKELTDPLPTTPVRALTCP